MPKIIIMQVTFTGIQQNRFAKQNPNIQVKEKKLGYRMLVKKNVFRLIKVARDEIRKTIHKS